MTSKKQRATVKKGQFLARYLHLQQCLGQGECGAAVCIKGSIERVAKPVIYLAQGSRMAKHQGRFVQKVESVCVGLGLTGCSSPVPSSLTCSPELEFSFWFDLGNSHHRQLLRVDSFFFSPSVAPVP